MLLQAQAAAAPPKVRHCVVKASGRLLENRKFRPSLRKRLDDFLQVFDVSRSSRGDKGV
jgi:hypothetical protein